MGASQDGRSPKRILVVDDEEAVAHYLHDLLTREGYQVTTALNGEAGLASCRKTRPDLMMLDMSMPGLSGLDVLVRARTEFPELPVMMLTANQDEELALKTLQLGAYEYFQKPIDRPRLLLAIRARLI